jgi:hypothetical protein
MWNEKENDKFYKTAVILKATCLIHYTLMYYTQFPYEVNINIIIIQFRKIREVQVSEIVS